MERYKHLNNYYKKIFGERTLKICIDGGFTCPNRDGTISTGGCIFCSERGSGEHLNSATDIKNQVLNTLHSKKDRANKFIVYFQNYTNTYDTIQNLKTKYDSALIDDRIVGISIATRPDCINDSIAQLLNTYTYNHRMFVELGLQTANSEILKKINTGYSLEDFNHAVSTLSKYNIEIITHIMVGLPGETNETIKETVDFINHHNIQGIKIHSCYIVENTKLCEMYHAGQYAPITIDAYLDKLEFIICHLRPDIIIHRLSGDAPKEILVAPSWNSHKKWILNGIEKRLNEKDLYQGIYYKKRPV